MDWEADAATAAGEELARSEARLRRAQNVARLGSWELDLATRAMWASEEAFRIYGLPRPPGGELPFALVAAVPLPEFRPLLDLALGELLAGTRPYDLRFRIRRHGDGALRTVHSFAEVFRGADGRPALVTGTVQDVTEREARDAELMAALRLSEERARLALEQAADAIFLFDAEGTFTSVNERAVALSGHPRAALLAGNIRMLFSSEVLAARPLRFDRVARGETVVAERLLTRRDGTQLPVEMHTRALSDGTLQSIIRDISERRRLEAQLQQRQRMDTVGALASGIAHDFNNIIAGILGFAALLRADEAALSPGQREAVAAILGSCRRATDLVQGLQMASREVPRETGVLDLGELAAEACGVVRETSDRVVTKEQRVSPGRWWVRGDASALYHALMNLLVNAVQAIEAKGAGPGDRVVVDADVPEPAALARLGLGPGRWLRLTVRDTGVGMTEEVRRRAFDPLFTTKEKGVRKGQGLGLAMVYNVVVRQHGGAVEIVSAPGEGATFHLVLPAADAPARAAAAGPAAPAIAPPPAAPPPPAPDPPSPAAASRVQETVLVVDDEEVIVRLARRVLERAGHRVLTAADGAEALERFGPHGHGVDLVLLDRTLPRLPGEAVLERLRALRPGVKVIICTGDGSVGADRFPGAAAILHKPYLPAELVAVIRRVLDGQAAAPADR